MLDVYGIARIDFGQVNATIFNFLKIETESDFSGIC
jgi:hypothetical protein